MGEITGIAWTDHTFNPWVGCSRVSPGCDNCYADAGSRRLGAQHGLKLWQGDHFFTGETYWKQPTAWARAAKRDGVRRRVFCASMADVFEERDELRDRRARLFRLIEGTPELDWLLLTKRPHAMVSLARDAGWPAAWPSNVWAGTTVEDQARGEERIPWLQEVPAAVRFLSVEPMIGPVDLENIEPYYVKPEHTKKPRSPHDPEIRWDCLRGHMKGPDDMIREQRVHWVIVGGESGPRARPFAIAWAESIVKQCQSANTPVFVKQLGARPALGFDSEEGVVPMRLNDKKGGDPAEWPERLRIREFPEVGS